MTAEHRAVDGDTAAIALAASPIADAPGIANGYAAVFNRRSHDLGGFTEIVAPGTFDASLAEDDIVGLWGHATEHLLGRIDSGTLRASVDERGLAFEIDLPNTSLGRDLAVLIDRGDIRGASFGFVTVRDEWHRDDLGNVTRTLLEVRLTDLSLVTRPAYPDTTAALRSLGQTVGRDLAEIRHAAERRALGHLLAPASKPDGQAYGLADRAAFL